MSQPRSPRWVCSMTVGMMKLLDGGRRRRRSAHGVVLFRLSQPWSSSAWRSAALRSWRACSGVTISEGAGSPSVILACAISRSSVFCSRICAFDLVRCGGPSPARRAAASGSRCAPAASSAMRFCRSASVAVMPSRSRDRLHEDGAARLLLGLGPHLLAHLRVVEPPRRRRPSSSAGCLARLTISLRVAIDQRGRDRELVALDQLLDQRPRHLALDALSCRPRPAARAPWRADPPASPPRRCPWPARRRARGPASRALP